MALKQQELDPEVKLFSQFEDTTDKTTILLNVFHVPLDKQEAFKKAWQKDAAFFERQPGASRRNSIKASTAATCL